MTKQTGFLTFRLGVQTVYCNRTKGGLWFTVSNGEPVKVDAVSFQSKQGGLRGLNIYEATRGGKDGWKVGLLLEDENSQVYKFETGSGTSFARGMLWAIASLSPEQVKNGQIGINPTPADPAKTKSANPGSILYCNMLCDGVELPIFSGEGRPDWQIIAQIALSKANNCEYPIAEIPASWVFSDDEGKSYSQPSSAVQQSGRSGITYPNAPLKAQQSPTQSPSEAVKKPTPDEIKVIEFLSGLYDEFMVMIEGVYDLNAVTIDQGRLDKFLETAKAKKFSDLSLVRKNQVTVSLVVEIVKEKMPRHKAIEEIEKMLKAEPLTLDHFDALSALTKQVFSELVPF
jgi:hypothetical protein